jgi:hypothetical protein
MAGRNTTGLIWFKQNMDGRGILTAVESDLDVPFTIRRVFWISNVPRGVKRGDHSHEKCAQVIIAVHGSVTIIVNETSYRLDKSNQGLYVATGDCITLVNFSLDCLCLVLCSEHYDPGDVIQKEGTK